MPNWIGDLVMATPILEGVRERYPKAHIVALCRGNGQMLSGNPHVDEVVTFSKGKEREMIRYLRLSHFDLGILLTNSFSSAWMFWRGRVKKRVGFFRLARAFLLNSNIPFPKNRKKQHLVLTYKQLLNIQGGGKPTLYIKPDAKAIGKTVIGINPAAAYGPAKCWLPERFREVAIRLIHEIPNVEVVFFGDLLTAETVRKICEGLPVVNLAGKTTLIELTSKIGSLDAFLTNDSGPMHIAAALGTPLVALFGSTNDIATGPYQHGRIIHKHVKCSPCYKRVCPIDFRCMTGITVDEVVRTLKMALLDKIRIVEPMQGVATEPKFATSFLPAQKKVGTIILAGGKGTRLGLGIPKGLLEIGGNSLYEILLRKTLGPVAIMTSPATHEATKKHVQADLFQMRCLPSVNGFDEFPEGNGAVFSAFLASGLLKKWDVDLISVIPVDNMLADPIDPEMIGGCEELIVKAIAREEKMGALVDVDGKLHVQEYTELRGDWKLGYTGMFMCTKEFFTQAASLDLPYHEIVRDGVKHYEKFVFDAFPLASRYRILLKKKESCFAPIKTKADIIHCSK